MDDTYGRLPGTYGQGHPTAPDTSAGHTRGYTTRRTQSCENRDGSKGNAFSPNGTEERPKPVKFVYSHARLPLRVHINKHDNTKSIITSVKTFFGIHEGLGVSFENEEGFNIIPQYENVKPDTDIQVRLTQDIQPLPQATGQYFTEVASPAKSTATWMDVPPSVHNSRPASRNARGGDLSPDPIRKYRMGSKAPKNPRAYDADGMSDSDGGSVSVTSSRRDVLVSADISVENIVEGNRRKGAKFESSELPLFKPPQMIPMTASVSSASPQKRFVGSVASPLPPSNHRTFSNGPQAFPSPVSYGHSEKVSTFSNSGYSYARESHMRTSGGHQSSRLSGGSANGILPTPAPTIGSGISDEDVALQLMRLGDPNNAPPPRPSASTADDALSGKAELASSAEYSEEDSDEGLERPRLPTKAAPPRKKLKALNTAIPSGDTYTSEEEYEDYRDGSFKGESDEIMPPVGGKKIKVKSSKSGNIRRASGTARPMPKMTSAKSKSNSTPGSAIPPSPYSLPAGSTKATSHFGSDEEDLSAKPRCQRCRKSKKGCDRQRPCGRCKDAGIGIEGCVSEDEGNGRKGRFGRHMGVAVKKTAMDSIDTFGSAQSPHAHSPHHGSGESIALVDANKKRKR